MKFILFSMLIVMGAKSLKGQGLIGVSDYIKDYGRLLEIEGSAVNNPIIFHSNQSEIWQYDSIPHGSLGVWGQQLNYYREPKSKGLSLYLLSPRLDYTFSSLYSRSYNDGPFWSSRGSTVGINAGLKLKWGPVSAQIYPNFYYAQNKHFQRQSPGKTGLSPRQDPLNYQLSNRIDWVQIFGFEPFYRAGWGQSSISVALGPVNVTFGNENMWWGPAVLNPIMMSNTAPGFPHLNIGTAKPIRTKYGDFEVNSIWGQLGESNYFSNIPSVKKRFITGLTMGYRPSFFEAFKGLSIGFSRIVYQNWPNDGLKFGDLFLILKNTNAPYRTAPDGSRTDGSVDQYLAFDLRWVFDKVGFETYFEWVRKDFWLNFKNLTKKDHPTGVFTIGLQKAHQASDATYKVGFEYTSLATVRTRSANEIDDIYTHTIVRQGYTHKGALLGAPIGPGSKSQLITINRYNKNGKYGFSINRIRFDDNYYFRKYSPTGEFLRHDVEWTFGLEAVRFFKQYEFSAKFNYSRRMNWHYYYDLDVNNFQVLTSVKWHISEKPLLSLFD